MITPTTAKKEKEPNYTPEMVAIIAAAAPLNYEKAEVLAEQLGKNVRSIIAKAKREKIEYIAKTVTSKKRDTPTKAEMVAAIVENNSDLTAKALTGLEKAPVLALQSLLAVFSKLAEDSETDVPENS